MEYHVSQVSGWKKVAEEIVSLCVKHTRHIVLLSGDLGAGKTTLAQEIARLFGVRETVNSPTFVIKKSYPVTHDAWNTLVHADLYRLTTPRELDTTALRQDLENEKAFVLIEWPEQISHVLNNPHVKVSIVHEQLETRKVTLEISEK